MQKAKIMAYVVIINGVKKEALFFRSSVRQLIYGGRLQNIYMSKSDDIIITLPPIGQKQERLFLLKYAGRRYAPADSIV